MGSGRRRIGKRAGYSGGLPERSSTGLVLGMLADGELASLLRQRIGREFRHCIDPREVLDLVRARRSSVVVISPLYASRRPIAGLVHELRAAAPTVRIVVYGELTSDSARALLDLGRAGAGEVYFRGIDDLDPAWPRTLRESPVPSIPAKIVPCLSGRLDPRLEAAVRYGLDHAAEALSAVGVSSAAGVPARTLSAWASAAGFPGIRGLIMACKAAVAVALVLESDYTVEAAALELGFASGSHLRSVVKRRTHATFGKIRARRDLRHWCGLIFRFRASRSSDTARR